MSKKRNRQSNKGVPDTAEELLAQGESAGVQMPVSEPSDIPTPATPEKATETTAADSLNPAGSGDRGRVDAAGKKSAPATGVKRNPLALWISIILLALWIGFLSYVALVVNG